MAGDWLKIETATPDKPEVYQVAAALGIDPDAAFGKLFRAWIWFDQNTEDGNAPIVTKMIIDRVTGIPGFSDAMISIGWLIDEGETIHLPNFDRHNGKTAKKRAVTARRVSGHKEKKRQGNAESNANSNDEGNASNVTKALPREEKSNTSIYNAREFQVTDEHREYSRFHRLPDPDEQILLFQEHYSGRGHISIDELDKLFRKWLVRAKGYTKGVKSETGRGTGGAGARSSAAEQTADDEERFFEGRGIASAGN